MPACANCGFNSEAGFRFCPSCGAGLPAAAAFGEQRKTVTVLFCDLTGSTAIGETLESVFAQTFTDYEVIVINDGSPDTAELEHALEIASLGGVEELEERIAPTYVMKK